MITEFEMVKLEIFIPVTHLEDLRKILQDAGAGAIGNYDSVMTYSPVRGCWRPLQGAQPYNGVIGELCEADEYRVDVCCRTDKLSETLCAIKAGHPYEEPVINVMPLLMDSF